MFSAFQFASTPLIHFGVGKRRLLPQMINKYGSKCLLITGANSFLNSDIGKTLLGEVEKAKIEFEIYKIDKEPTPEMIDNCVAQFKDRQINVVVGIGGGSVLDAGKAISAMLCEESSIVDFLEGVGTKVCSGNKIPFIAVPTTSGTGSEATKNAVITKLGVDGFKKSLRHDKYVPNIALLDPELTINCPQSVTAASGMDAFTQLLESYVSTSASSMTDALAFSGLEKIELSLKKVATYEGDQIDHRYNMAYASLMSGVTLANAGLGTVHGFASSIGGYFDIPHGVICGTLMGTCNELNVEYLKKNDPNDVLAKYAKVGRLFFGDAHKSKLFYADFLVELIHDMIDLLKIKSLGDFGVQESDFEKILGATANKNNPVELKNEDLVKVLNSRL